MMEILIIEDHDDINALIANYLTKAGYHCVQAYAGTEGYRLFEESEYDLVILDLMLPGMDGKTLLEKMRQASDVPVIVLTAKDALASKVDLLSAGADDYLCKPFELEELLARIQVQQLRRRHKQSAAVSCKGLKLDGNVYDAFYQGTALGLTRHEYYILELLMKNPKRVFTKQEIYEYAWNDTYYGDDKTINVHISNLRKKIAKHSDEDYIKTIWGIGFKMAD